MITLELRQTFGNILLAQQLVKHTEYFAFDLKRSLLEFIQILHIDISNRSVMYPLM